MKDRAGNELEVGDHIIYLLAGKNTTTLETGVVDSFTPQKVRVKDNRGVLILRDPSSVVKPFTEPCIYDCTICHEGDDDVDIPDMMDYADGHTYDRT